MATLLGLDLTAWYWH